MKDLYISVCSVKPLMMCLPTPITNLICLEQDCIQEGTAVTIFCSGIMVQETMKANEILKQEGIDAEIINIHTIKPIDRDAVVASAKKTAQWLLQKITM